jgi:hypothetical protein
MRRLRPVGATCRANLALAAALTCSAAFADGLAIQPAGLSRIGMVDERFQSYNIEMVEITGGRFWRPYGFGAAPSPAGPKPDLFASRPPIDLTSARLRKLAAALAPAYMRVSGTWANSTYFADADTLPPVPPAGFNGLLTRQQWRGVVDFAQAVDARIVTSFAISPGTRDADGAWTADQAQRLMNYTHSVGGRIAAAEFMNEPDLVSISGAPPGFDAAAYGRDFKAFLAFARRAAPGMAILGPGAAGDEAAIPKLLAASGPGLDVFSYHFYGALSERCTGGTTPDAALSEEWLARTDKALALNQNLRDRFEPGKPIWLTESAQAACGGDRWAATFLDTFRYLDQMGRLAKAGVQVVMHNTLAASDYGLLDQTTLAPRPNYWGALLWRQLMGAGVLEAGVPAEAGLHVYAHCQRGVPGGVALLVINTDRAALRGLTIAGATQRFGLEASGFQDGIATLNGTPLALSDTGDLPRLAGVATAAGEVTFAPGSITFLAMPTAANAACRN